MDTVQVPSRTALPNRSQYTESVLMLDFRKLYKIKSSMSSKSSVTPDVRLHTSRIEANKQQPQQEFWTTSALHGRNSDYTICGRVSQCYNKGWKTNITASATREAGEEQKVRFNEASTAHIFAFRGLVYEVHPETHQVPFIYNSKKPSTVKARYL